MGEKDPLLSAICHDLRAPLAAVTMGANFVLQTTPKDDASARSVKILEAMLRSCTQMERLIRSLSEVAEIEGAGVELRVAPHDATELVDATAESVSEAARARAVTLDVRKPQAPVPLVCDRERLLRALGQITENAVRHAPANSAVTIEVAVEGENVAITVSDRGPGLSPELREHLFDRKWHARRTNRAGPGNGLAIARGYVEAHGGELRVAALADGPTTFSLVVPRARPV